MIGKEKHITPISLDAFNPKLTLRDLSDVFFALGLSLKIRLVPLQSQRDPILDNAWARLAEYQSGRK